MRDKQLKDMCIMLGIQLPCSAYDSNAEMERAKAVHPDYEPCIAEVVRDAEKSARVIEAEDRKSASQSFLPEGITSGMYKNDNEHTLDRMCALGRVWAAVDLLVERFYANPETIDLVWANSLEHLGYKSKKDFFQKIESENSKYLNLNFSDPLPEAHCSPKRTRSAFTGVRGTNRDIYFAYVNESPAVSRKPEEALPAEVSAEDMIPSAEIIEKAVNSPEFPYKSLLKDVFSKRKS